VFTAARFLGGAAVHRCDARHALISALGAEVSRAKIKNQEVPKEEIMPLRTGTSNPLRSLFAGLALLTLLFVVPGFAQFTPSDDAYVNSAGPTTNYGAAGTLGVESPSQTSFIRFDLTAVPSGYTGAQVAKATLKLFVNGVTAAGNFNIDLVSGSWTEKTITYSLQPALGNTIASGIALTTASKNCYIEVDVTSTVQAWLNGTEPNDGIALVANSPLNATFTTKENTGTSHPPELDIVYLGSGAPGPAGPTGPQGPQGPQGTIGPQGATGLTGPQGPTGPAGVVNSGTWSPNIQYQINESVSYDGSSWIALLPNLDSAPNATSPNWQLLAAKGINNQGAWVQTISYQVDDAVTSGGEFWLAVAPNLGSQPSTQNPNWQLIAATGAQGPQGKAGPQGPGGATGATGPQGPAGAQGVPGPIGPVGPTGSTGPQGSAGPAGPVGMNNRGTWAAGVAYNLNDAVTDQGQYWLAIVANPTVEPSKQGTPPSWQLVAAQGAAGPNGPAGPTGPQGPQGASGTGTINGVTAGTGLIGGGATGTVTLNLDTTKVPQLAAVNTFTNNNAVSVNSPSSVFQISNSGNGDTLDLYPNGGGAGVAVQGGYASVLGCCAYGIPVWGYDGPNQGVEGDSNTNSYMVPGVLGTENGATEGTVGVFGEVASPSGAGVYGQNQSTQSNTGGNSIYGAGVWGDAGSSGFAGILGTADDGIAGYFVNNGNYPPVEMLSSGFSLGFYASTPGGVCYMDYNANLNCTGAKNAVVSIDGGQRIVSMSAIESPKNWFEDFGSEQLSSGAATITIESGYAQTVNTEQNYHVYLTPNGDCKGLYISHKTPTSFEVRELGGGSSNVAFDYRIVALRKNMENIRLADHTHDLDNIKSPPKRETPAQFNINKLLPQRKLALGRPLTEPAKK
jgi:hypothetical protein